MELMKRPKSLFRLVKNLENDPDIAAASAKAQPAVDPNTLKTFQARARRIVKCALLRYKHQTEDPKHE